MSEEIEHSETLNFVRSEEVQEIIGTVPHWILRYGLVLMMLVIIGLFVAAYYIQYPDTLQANVIITAQNPPANIIAKSTGKLKKIYVQDKDTIEQNQILAEIENTANTDSILQLKSILDTLNILDTTKSMQISGADLGEVSNSYQVLVSAQNDYRYLYTDISTKQKIENIEKQINYQLKLQKKLKNANVLTTDKLHLEEKKFDADKYLSENKVTSQMEFVESQKKLLDNKLNVENTAASIITNQLGVEQLKQSIIGLYQQDVERKKNSMLKLNEAYIGLKTEIENWQLKYLLRSPQAGIITFTKFWAQNQDVVLNDAVFTIVSPEEKIFAKAEVPIYKSAQMRIGQKVNIKLANYPSEQYGMLMGKVRTISDIPLKENYLVTIDFPRGLITTYNKKLHFYPEMKATGVVILKEESLLYRLLLKFRKVKEELKQ